MQYCRKTVGNYIVYSITKEEHDRQLCENKSKVFFIGERITTLGRKFLIIDFNNDLTPSNNMEVMVNRQISKFSKISLTRQLNYFLLCKIPIWAEKYLPKNISKGSITKNKEEILVSLYFRKTDTTYVELIEVLSMLSPSYLKLFLT